MNSESLPERLILASTSKYRKLLLQRLGIPFECKSPDTDETPNIGETPHSLVTRLATLKAASVAKGHPFSVVIGSDQLAVLDDEVLGKPGNHQCAVQQLSACSGNTVSFLTAVSIQCVSSGFEECYTDTTDVHFRNLAIEEIESYLKREQPYDCAGSFKSESQGIVLFDRIDNQDPSALIGLPLIRTAAMLRRAGIQIL